MSKPRGEPGDKPQLFGGSPQDKIVLIHDMIDLIQKKGPKTLHVLTKDLSEFLHAQQALSSSNLYRKQYGNLNHVFAAEDFRHIFHIEKDVISLLPLDHLEQAKNAGELQPEEFEKCIGMWKNKNIHDLTTLRTTFSNVCSRCHETYRESVSHLPLCSGSPHTPSYDFSRDDDVLKCKI